MGVDYYTCSSCGTNFPDCGEYGVCAKCEEYVCAYCHDEHIKKYGTVEEGSNDADYYGETALLECDACTASIVRDDDVITYLLAKTGLKLGDVKDTILVTNTLTGD